MKDTSIEIELNEIVHSPPTELTEDEKNLLAKQLNDSLVSKIDDGTLSSKIDDGTLERAGPRTNPLGPRPDPIDLSRYGLHNPGDIKVFLLSPAGETVKH